MEKIILAIIAIVLFKVIDSSYISYSYNPFSYDFEWHKTVPNEIPKAFPYVSYPLSSNLETLTYIKCNTENCKLIEKKNFHYDSSKDFNSKDGFNSSVQPRIEIIDNSRLILIRDMHRTLKNENIKINVIRSSDSIDKIQELSFNKVSSVEVCSTGNMNFDVFYTSTNNTHECYQVICREKFYSPNSYSTPEYDKRKFFDLAGKTDNSEYSWKPIIIKGHWNSYLLTLNAAGLSNDIINTLYRIDKDLIPYVLLRSKENNIVYSQVDDVLSACYKKKSTSMVICRQYNDYGWGDKNFEVNIERFSSTWETDQIAVHKNEDALVLLLLNRIESDDIYWKINNFTLIEIYSNIKPPKVIGSKEVKDLKCSKKYGIHQWTTPVPTIRIFESNFDKKSFNIQFICSFLNETTNEADVNMVTSDVDKVKKWNPYIIETNQISLQKRIYNRYPEITLIIFILISLTVLIYYIIRILSKLFKKCRDFCCKSATKNDTQSSSNTAVMLYKNYINQRVVDLKVPTDDQVLA